MDENDVKSLFVGGLMVVPLMLGLLVGFMLLARAPDVGMKGKAGAAAGHHQAPRP